ncbi:hypothetical protein BC938DRAFT_483315 [Jimgerdemannia flammicorona]|uniref:Uncharacterized protein n=1 Tax=Jimgerdemannia flammicorona TaxID=994334 RepID=A0A433QC88_9FUNG|nr:hypothetical protein BC938DRAFT_483315 [Jimgerdemannia flammicorona]
MSSVSSHGSSSNDQPPFHPRFTFLRKTDILDSLDASAGDRGYEADRWSVAATIDDDTNSVISGTGGGTRSISGGPDKEQDDHEERRTERRAEERHQEVIEEDDEDKRENGVAEDEEDHAFDDSRSAVADFGDDEISAPPQPQPSFVVTKSYQELLEENELLASQLRDLELAHKQQAQLVENLKVLAEGNEDLAHKALQAKDTSEQHFKEQAEQDKEQILAKIDNAATSAAANHVVNSSSSTVASIIGSSLADKLNRLIISVHNLVSSVSAAHPASSSPQHIDALKAILAAHLDPTDPALAAPVPSTAIVALLTEKQINDHLVTAYLGSLPFGTADHEGLNSAYAAQLSRFRATLGQDAASWFRKQTVRSLPLHPDTRAYLQTTAANLGSTLYQLLAQTYAVPTDRAAEYRRQIGNLLELAEELSLEIHAGEKDVCAQDVERGSVVDDYIMTVVPVQGEVVRSIEEKVVRFAVNHVFSDEEGYVHARAKVVLV